MLVPGSSRHNGSGGRSHNDQGHSNSTLHACVVPMLKNRCSMCTSVLTRVVEICNANDSFLLFRDKLIAQAVLISSTRSVLQYCNGYVSVHNAQNQNNATVYNMDLVNEYDGRSLISIMRTLAISKACINHNKILNAHFEPQYLQKTINPLPRNKSCKTLRRSPLALQIKLSTQVKQADNRLYKSKKTGICDDS